MKTHEELLAERRKWRWLNREKINAYQRAYFKKRRKEYTYRQKEALYVREYRKRRTEAQIELRRIRQKEYRLKHLRDRSGEGKHRKEKDKAKRIILHAHQKVNYALKKGRIVKPPNCQRCGMFHSRLHGHHSNYERALEVEWLCPSCHFLEHEEKIRKAHKHSPWTY